MLVTVIDKIVWAQLGPSYVDNVRAANISYWLIAALDPETSLGLGSMGAVGHCFNAPADRLVYKGSGAGGRDRHRQRVLGADASRGCLLDGSNKQVWLCRRNCAARKEGRYIACLVACFCQSCRPLATDAQYKWGSNHWTQTTWNKVCVHARVRLCAGNIPCRR